MASDSYSFIDIAVLDPVRERFAAGDSLLILSSTLDEIAWANGPGAALLGYATVEAAIGSPPNIGALATRQIRATRGFPDIPGSHPVSVRLTQGLASFTVAFLASGITLPDGEAAILLAQPTPQAGAGGQQAAKRAISGFASEDYIAAIVDADGRVMAASRDPAEPRLDHEAILGLVGDVGREKDRLVKKLVEVGTDRIPCGIARLTDDPVLHLLVIVETAADVPTESLAPVATEEGQRVPPADAVAMREETADKAAATNQSGADADGEDHWYFKDGEDDTRKEAAGTVATDASARSGSESAAGEAAEPPASPPSDPCLPSSPMKFVWRTDADGRFSSISDDFIRTLGGMAEEIVGRSFAEVASALGFDQEGEIARLLERRDTWSGHSVMWPVKGTAWRVPVDLAGLPIYGRERVFEGFRGFGVARFGEAVTVPLAAGTTGTAPQTGKSNAPEKAPHPANDDSREVTTGQPSMRERIGGGAETHAPEADGAETHVSFDDPFEGEPPALAVERGPERRFSDKIIRLAEHRSTLPENGLSSAERHAFREIGARLKKEDAASAPEKHGQEEQRPAAPATGDAAKTEVTHEAPASSDSEAEGRTTDATVAPETVAEVPGETPVPSREAEASPQEATDGNPAEPATETDVSAAAAETREVEETRASAARGTTDAESIGPDGVSEAPAAAEIPEPHPKARAGILAGGDTPSAFFLPAHVRPELYSTILSRLPLPVLIHAGDILHYANPRFLELVGYPSIEEIGSAGGLGELFADPTQTENGKDRKLCLKHKDGGIFPVEAFLQSVPWENGKALLMALGHAEKQVEPKPAEQEPAGAVADAEALNARIGELGAIIDTATDGVVLLDKEGTIRSISRPAEALFGFDNADVVGKPFASLFAIESQRAARDYLASLSDNGVASVLNDGLELIGREAEGRFIPLFMTIGRLPHENGYCAVVRDVTQWKRAEEELTQARSLAERASSQKTDFLARISHEIRTPLNAIIGFSELIMDEKFGPVGNERYRDYLRDINRSGNHVLDLVNDLLDISKIEAGEQEMNYEAVSLNETLAETVAMMQPQANRERVIIRSSFLSRLPEVVADLRSMRQIALNLLSNAIRYTLAGGQVIVSTAYEPTGEVVIRVRDTGIGMSQVEIEQALKPFKQLNALKRPRGDGTGLGLPLTKAMVEANRARFSIHSVPGEGTLVEVSFPSTRVLAD